MPHFFCESNEENDSALVRRAFDDCTSEGDCKAIELGESNEENDSALVRRAFDDCTSEGDCKAIELCERRKIL